MVRLILLSLWAFSTGLSQTPQSPFARGSGTTTDPYQIETPQQLDAIRDNSRNGGRNYAADTFVLLNDLDFSSYTYDNLSKGWLPIGHVAVELFVLRGSPFTGSFEGQGYVIRNLFIDRSDEDRMALFGYIVGGVVDSLGLEAVNITGNAKVGGLVGENVGTVSNCYATGDVSGNFTVGGLIGLNNVNDEGSVTNCYATATVSDAHFIGGLIGKNFGTVSNCYATGDVSGNSSIGGFSGENDGIISNCYATGEVSEILSAFNIGGFVGLNYRTIRTCYATGEVSGSRRVGGLVGANDEGSVTTVANSYWNTQTSGQSASAGGTGLTTMAMYVEDNYGGWDFATVWNVPSAVDMTFPLLRGMLVPVVVPTLARLTFGQAATNITHISARITIQSTATGTLHYGALASGGTVPTHLSDFTGLTSAGTLNINNVNAEDVITLASLSPSTTYTVYAVLVGDDGSTLLSAITPSSATFTTSALPSLRLSILAHDVPTAGGNLMVDVTANVAWTVTLSGVIPGGWLALGAVSPQRGTSDATVTIAYTENTMTIIRMATLTFETQGGDPMATLTIRQASPSPFAGGLGTEASPYQISAVEHLNAIRKSNSENYLDDHFVLTADLDFSSYTYDENDKGWLPIGDDTNNLVPGFQGMPFTGSFHGKGFSIRNLRINRSTEDYIGLFGQIGSDAMIDSLSVENVDIIARREIGGLVGSNRGGSIAACYATGSVEGYRAVGGLVGENAGTLKASYAAGAMSGNAFIGGLVGINSTSIVDCYATGAVSGQESCGGLVGVHEGESIMSSYATAVVRGERYVGGLVGENDSDSSEGEAITNSYWNTETSGTMVGAGSLDGMDITSTLTGLTALTTRQMYVQRFFNGFNFEEEGVWHVPTATSFPRLRGVSKNAQVLHFPAIADAAVGDADFTLGGYRFLSPVTIANADTTFLSSKETVARVDAATGRVTIVGLGETTLTITRTGNDEYVSVSASQFLRVPPFMGSGTAVSPFQIHNMDDLNAIRGVFLADTFELMNDLDFSSYTYHTNSSENAKGWLPIGHDMDNSNNNFDGASFTGSFHGGGYVIGNLRIDRSNEDAIGLFGRIGAGGRIDHLGLVDVDITGRKFVGTLIGENNGTVLTSYSTGTVIGTDSHVGGLVGQNKDGTVENSYSTGTVSGNSTVGGLVGGNLRGAVSKSYSIGVVTGTEQVGGLVGQHLAGNVENSYWNTETSGTLVGAVDLDGMDITSTLTGLTGLTTAAMYRQSNFEPGANNFMFGNNDTWFPPSNTMEDRIFPRLRGVAKNAQVLHFPAIADAAVGDDPFILNHTFLSPATIIGASTMFTSSNMEVARVDEDGEVTILRAGTTILTITRAGGHGTNDAYIAVSSTKTLTVTSSVMFNFGAATNITSTEATLDIHSTQTGTIHYGALEPNGTVPNTLTDLQNLTSPGTLTISTQGPAGAQNIRFTGLTPSTPYTVYAVLVDRNDMLLSAITPGTAFTTKAVLNFGDATNITSTEASLDIHSTQTGTIHYGALERNGTVPNTLTDLQNLTSPGTLSISTQGPAGAQNIRFTGLTPSTTYTAYAVLVDGDDMLLSAITPGTAFTTKAVLNFGAATNITSTEATLDIHSTQTGTIHYGALERNGAVPNTLTELQNLTSPGSLTISTQGPAGAQNIRLTGLTPSTPYTVYAALVDGNDMLRSAITPGTAFTTKAVLNFGAATNITSTEATLDIHSTQTGTIHYGALERNGAVPNTLTDLQNLTSPGTLTISTQGPAGTQNIRLTGLTPNTTYTVYATLVDGNDRQLSDIEASHAFMTADEPVITLLDLEPKELPSLLLHPNPVEHFLFLKEIDSYEYLKVYDLNGNLVHSQKEGSRIDIHLLPAGVYILNVQKGNHLYHTRILKKGN